MEFQIPCALISLTLAEMSFYVMLCCEKMSRFAERLFLNIDQHVMTIVTKALTQSNYQRKLGLRCIRTSTTATSLFTNTVQRLSSNVCTDTDQATAVVRVTIIIYSLYVE